jgi:hypothetical protein
VPTWPICRRRQRAAGARGYKGKEADQLVLRVDRGVVSLVAELRAHERGHERKGELYQWKTHHEGRKVIDASPAAITLTLLLTGEELDSLAKRAGDGEIAMGGRPGGSNVASPQPAARHGEPPKYSPPIGVIGWSRIRAVAGGAADGRPSLSRFPPLKPGSGPRLTLTGRRHGRSDGRRERVAGVRLQGQQADRLMTRIDPGVVLLVAELRGHERQAAGELEQWKTRVEE